jgi:hypothetical protein
MLSGVEQKVEVSNSLKSTLPGRECTVAAAVAFAGMVAVGAIAWPVLFQR